MKQYESTYSPGYPKHLMLSEDCVKATVVFKEVLSAVHEQLSQFEIVPNQSPSNFDAVLSEAADNIHQLQVAMTTISTCLLAYERKLDALTKSASNAYSLQEADQVDTIDLEIVSELLKVDFL